MSSGKIVCEIYFASRYFLRGGFRGSVRVQLKYINKKSRPAAASLLLFCLAPKGMVETKRIELSTLRMRTVRSPRLSYGPKSTVPKAEQKKQYEIIRCGRKPHPLRSQLSYRPIFESHGSLKTEQYFEISDVRPTRS